MRTIVLDTETTGIDPKQGHRIIEIGCVEVINRKLTGNSYHQYINPQREVEQEAIEIHGITNEMLVDKPVFAEIAADFFEFIKGAELVIHNAPFDVGFINHEFGLLASNNPGTVENYCRITDSLVLARNKHPGAKNNLDALCKRYGVDNSARTYHGALLDAEILADVYLLMTGGQTALAFGGSSQNQGGGQSNQGQIKRLAADRPPLPVISATADELAAHEAKLDVIAQQGQCVWRDKYESSH
ncbi:DNA polymerase III subunit epsilon [Endozoicomonas sp. SM1973]|uniref:DNA polymerase III subunit epsilon n=1 Tax=Spartinivicinus marinus TaxID=2994442 RepID=A0A853IDX4_9GAMM|nr:DNA polymerase III subunit epsilon [Spartinivicinus marinus]MCX4024797.1 DNA polymerase III subunit epsilon [Spartinivicinus marinus]NYZ68748.1 DNA polymerase III subunit epsilon [Spartinivicinus marinus]